LFLACINKASAVICFCCSLVSLLKAFSLATNHSFTALWTKDVLLASIPYFNSASQDQAKALLKSSTTAQGSTSLNAPICCHSVINSFVNQADSSLLNHNGTSKS